MHFLYGSKDEFDPTLGLFFPQEKGTPQQSSLWMGLLSSDLAEDSEAIANLLREMKKQIKRIYPNLLEEIIAEKLVISEFSHGIVDLGLKEAGILPEQKALFLADPAQTGRLPLSGAIEAARLAVNWALNSLSESISAPTFG
ncbi:MAG: hypothetical protein KDD35_03650, partial [Bdellovibrionales bacterium]|nr:hypothetical protein [Bdellovibrionales bacterium]